MTQSNTQIEVSELDFQNIKDSLKEYLQNQSQFSDFDFEGSNLNILLDILAYNTHYQSFYLNMVANEAFLDSAQLRKNVVSRAKELGYTPVSARGATAVLDLTVTPSNTNIVGVTVPKNLEFTATSDNETLTYVTPQAYNINERNQNNQFKTQIEIVEGIPLTHRFTVTGNNNLFTIPNDNVDTRSISVNVKQSNTSNDITKFKQANDLKTVGGDSEVFFVQEGDNGQYQIQFGDNVLGKKLENNNVVVIEYRVTNAEDGNGARNFTLEGNVDGHSNVDFTVVESAKGGVSQEGIESIKFNAPKHYERQDRLVSITDYKSYIREQYPEFDSVAVWGGEDNNPPVYGKVFISIKPADAEIISTTLKQNLEEELRSRNVVTLDVDFVDAEFIYLEFDVTVKYDNVKTNLTTGALANKVQSAIINYGENSVGKFGNKFRYSRLTRAIDDSDTSIQGNLTDVRMQKRLTPILNSTQKYTIDFKNAIKGGTDPHPIHQGHQSYIYSNNSFKYKGFSKVFLEDNAEGNIEAYRIVNNKKINIDNNIGSVDYDTGVITLDSIIIEDVNDGDDIEIVAIPKNQDISSVRNNIILFDESQINVKMVEDGN